ncbi:hypothetical protein H310_01927 [Aphanomyces invadans]|uniref:Uncharacterized protein n=1 Tax=Aphanomyces invadans TaxID=157072 RepID=A0A024UNL0_9STRA|nr:hypothetical protein H310_01927 [Aphanomyces invadans]ETW07402.1 hypothetical protein H310_01927 [Aphanomyces invadans]|eukprot:XP_008863495.1 hypothetical protein H310_01927 [Aphanomyces invadans]
MAAAAAASNDTTTNQPQTVIAKEVDEVMEIFPVHTAAPVEGELPVPLVGHRSVIKADLAYSVVASPIPAVPIVKRLQ